MPSSRRGPELEPKWLRQWLYGSDGVPTPRGVVGFVFLQVMSRAPRFEAGDGHKHGCLDALTIALGSYPEYEHAALASHQLTRRRGRWLRIQVWLTCHFTMSTCEGFHGSITWSTILSDGVHRLIIGTIVMFEDERVEFLMSKLVRVVLDVRLSPSKTRVGFKRSCSPCRLIGVRGRTNRRGFHGSTSEHRNGLCAVVPVSHAYLGATASDLGSLGESVRR